MGARNASSPSAVPSPVHPHAAGIDIGATALYAAVDPTCTDAPIRRFETFTRDLHALADWLQACGVDTVAMESTGVYWIPVFQILEVRGFEVLLVNARHVKQVPGRKSDVSDCEWLRYLHAVGLLRGSFRPPNEVCAVRTLLRHRDGLVKTASRAVLHMQKALDQMNIHLHQVLSELTSQSGLRIVDAMLAGQQDAAQLARLAHPRVKATPERLVAALEGDWRPEHLFTLKQARQTYAHYQTLIQACDEEIVRHMEQIEADPPDPSEGAGKTTQESPIPPTKAVEESPAPFDVQAHLARLFGTDLTCIPGIGPTTVQTLFAEVGPDLSAFPTAGHFCSWLGLCPRNEISGDKVLRSRTRPGAQRVAQVLRWATQSLYRSQSYLGGYFRRMRTRLGTPKATTATAHKLARIIYHLVTENVDYDESHFDQLEQDHRDRAQTRLRRQAKALGFQLVPTEGV